MPAQHLYPAELIYELELRGIVNPHLLDRGAQCETLDLYQRDEINSGTAPEAYCNEVQRDISYIQEALTAIEPLTTRLPNVSELVKEGTQARLIHLHNRARRMSTKTRSQYNLRESLLKAIVAAQYLWRSTDTTDVHRNNQSTPENGRPSNVDHLRAAEQSNSINLTQLAQQPTPTRMANPTLGGAIIGQSQNIVRDSHQHQILAATGREGQSDISKGPR